MNDIIKITHPEKSAKVPVVMIDEKNMILPMVQITRIIE